MLRILGKRSSINVRKVLWTCAEIDLPYTREDWGIGFRSTGEPGFRDLNPNAQVPVIVDGDFVLWESNTILRYLVTKHQRHDLLPPADPGHAVARARVEQWIDWQATDFNTAWRYAFLALARRLPGYDDAAQIAASLDAWAKMLGIVEDQLGRTGGHIAGPDFTLADIAVGLGVHRWMRTPVESLRPRPDFPRVAAYHDRLATRPGFVAHGSPAET